MSKSSPTYRGIYTNDPVYDPNGTTVKQNPKRRGIYAFDTAKKPDGVAANAAPAPYIP